MGKVYDYVNWNYMSYMLTSIGFGHKVVHVDYDLRHDGAFAVMASRGSGKEIFYRTSSLSLL